MMKQLTISAVLFLTASGVASAHTPLCMCFDNGDNSITCEGGYSDGSSASGVGIRVENDGGEVLQEGAMDANSEFTFERPQGEFNVVFDGGEGHRIVVSGKEIAR